MLKKLKIYVFSHWDYLLWGSLFFIVPALGLSQLVTGTVVNTLLTYGAVKWGIRRVFPLTIVPSLVSIALGILFGPFTIFVLYFAPIIVLSNNILVAAVKNTQTNKALVRYLLPGALKALVLFTIAYILTKLGLVPTIFLTTMGGIQFVTATLGVLIGTKLAKL